jgi:GH3 auxin-responsive promoter
MLARLAVPLLQALCAPRARRFAAALQDCAAAQAAALRCIVAGGAATGYARSHGLRADDGVAAFRDKIPVCTYAGLEEWINAQRAGRAAAITPGRVHCYEPSSGSSGAAKAIPYNRALQGSFRSLFAIWADDLLRQVLRPRSGRVFISVSPRFGAAGGLADDSDYLGAAQRLLLRPFLLAPPRGAATLDEFRTRLAVALLGCSDLEILSVWNPSYLLVLMDFVEQRDAALLAQLPAAARRVLENEAQPWPLLWPQLQLLSCWTGAAAAGPARELARRLPQARVQGKGLLATEAPVSVPLLAAQGCVPLLDEVFLEFQHDDGAILLLHEVEYAAEYEIILSQRGGLLRYRLGDRVRVSGRYRDTPLLEFLGRADAVADLVGEKLHEDFVAACLGELFGDGCAMLLPLLPQQGRPRYVCLAEADALPPQVEYQLDTLLRRNPRYAEARALDQLGAPLAIAIAGLRGWLLDQKTTAGLRLGDIKDRQLVTDLAAAARLHAAARAP